MMVTIFATDSDQDAIEKSKKGIYKESSLKNLISFKLQILIKYFLKVLVKNTTVWVIKYEI